MSGYWFCPNATSSCSSCLWLKVVRWRLLAGEGYALLRLLNPTATEVSHNVPFLTDSPISVFRGEKRKGEGVVWILFFLFFREKFPRSYFFTSSTWHKKCGLNWKSSNSPMTVSKKGGITRLSGSHWHQATWEPESFSKQTQAREKQTPETGGFVQDYYHNHQQRDSSP